MTEDKTEAPAVDALGHFVAADGHSVEIRDVWASNLEEEMENIRNIIEDYPYVAMDTEFPGVVARPICEFGANDYQYQTLRCNVDMLKLIQLGLSFTDEKGNFAPGCSCWQFNFKFSLADDMFAQDSIDLLKASGIDFQKFAECGIDVARFGELMMMSGLILTEDVKWVSFHSGYDFGYLLKTLTCEDLPTDETAFIELLYIYFPCIYDIKFMMTAVEGMHGGLNALAEGLQVERLGPMHQAGSDSLLTASTFFSFVQKHMGENWDEKRFRGELFGLGNNYTKYKARNPTQPVVSLAHHYPSGQNGNFAAGGYHGGNGLTAGGEEQEGY
mmetsp:Transcript_11544/g.17575  ORF Transcript_11544/g.17575 Transcript_11544/m.17575 type:complete len:329 (+) Transcript_11544:125-1111(+)|eukprot:CAMPEP_0185017456 /NCGR_PEP_ID=MMETSP1103-20130426/405_1 /TAXON_ID=36769 /ORGANISM="Paraphysomonas bandaiensis, Strain Caron Lab Isolate" /LENGTH=328 /DNA_ID=CAMNT_0027546877 /DNA_START=125 /DNA_END=1111 /DNA_ORIENTATION=+